MTPAWVIRLYRVVNDVAIVRWQILERDDEVLEQDVPVRRFANDRNVRDDGGSDHVDLPTAEWRDQHRPPLPSR